MENWNDIFWCAKKIADKFLHLYDHLQVYIHIILKSSVLKSEYLNATRSGLV